MSQPTADETNYFDLMMRYEDEGLQWGEMLNLFSHLIKTDLAWSLQGAYGRTARRFIEEGQISPEGVVLV